MLSGLRVDAARMRANLDAARGLPMAEHVTAVLAPALGRLAAHDLIARASRVASGSGRALGEVLLDTAGVRRAHRRGRASARTRSGRRWSPRPILVPPAPS